jgi:hypothetical protein
LETTSECAAAKAARKRDVRTTEPCVKNRRRSSNMNTVYCTSSAPTTPHSAPRTAYVASLYRLSSSRPMETEA